MQGNHTHQFSHAIGETVVIIASGESGKVIARAQHDCADDQFLIRYKAADGRAVEAWWTESALATASNQ